MIETKYSLLYDVGNYILNENDHTQKHMVAMGDKVMYLIRIKFGQIK